MCYLKKHRYIDKKRGMKLKMLELEENISKLQELKTKLESMGDLL